MTSQLVQLFQDILDGKIAASPDLINIIEDKDIRHELQEQISTFNLSEIPHPELFPTFDLLLGDEPISSEELLFASPLGLTNSPESEMVQIEKNEPEKTTVMERNEGKITEKNTHKIVKQLEVIVKIFTRPVIYIKNDTFNADDPIASQYLLPTVKEKLKKAQEFITPAIKASGRIGIFPNQGNLDYLGTGWLIADDIIVTNRHVAMCFANGEKDTAVSFQPGKEVYINFKAEYSNEDEALFKIESILYVQDVKKSPMDSVDPDIAFLRVSKKGVSGIPLPDPISLSDTPVEKGRDVVVIGYPGPLSNQDGMRIRENFNIFYNIFQGIFGVKRLQPGQIQIDETKKDSRIAHDCTTLGGNSGSVVLDIETGRSVGLHFAGKYDSSDQDLTMNYAVPASIIREVLDQVIYQDI
ncbi:MAG TPA: trypsin-like peptidase domain-containing protein [Trichormus sp. M33_DOE_039]|nr:trypsin-like peptidase domain-containing protein [Trichormus sp. M33_DOE_039]